MIVEVGDPPEEIIDAIRALTTTGAVVDTEIESLVVLDWLMLGFGQKARERVLNWAWDRYVEQPKRDALKSSDADKGTDVGDDRASDDAPAVERVR